MSKRGKFIIFEGLDGAGTTTQSRELGQYFSSQNIPYHLTREPSDLPIGIAIRQVLTGSMHPQINGQLYPMPKNPYILAHLFLADRFHHVEAEVIPNLERGINVISDRYYPSSLAYQTQDDVGYEELFEMHKRILHPDITFFLEISYEVAYQRISHRGKPKEYFEYLDKLKIVAANYKETFERVRDLDNVITINGELPIDEISRIITKEIELMNK